jgi:arginyl-tRNA synthetase
MEYGEAINQAAADTAFRVALRLRAEEGGEPREIAARVVTETYCVCVTEGEDAAERGLSNIHADLIDRLVGRLIAHPAEERN